MKKVERFDKPTANMVVKVAEQAVRDALAPFGLQVRRRAGTYTGGSFVMKIEAFTVSEGGLANSKEAEDFRANAVLFGFQEDDLGRTYTDRKGQVWKVVGLLPRRKFPVMVERSDGQRYTMPAAQVLRGLGREVPQHLIDAALGF